MTKRDIIEVLENIQNKIENIEDKKTKEILSVLYNLVEDVLSDNLNFAPKTK